MKAGTEVLLYPGAVTEALVEPGAEACEVFAEDVETNGDDLVAQTSRVF